LGRYERLGRIGEFWIEGFGETRAAPAGENGGNIGSWGLEDRKDRDLWCLGFVQV